MLGDIRDRRLLVVKGFLFLLTGGLAAAALLVEHPTLQHAALMAIMVWAFCRFYYFLFYVIEKYIDANHRFAGVLSAIVYVLRRR